MKLPGRVWIAVHRTQNRWHDLLAILYGYCNDCPRKSGLLNEGGGYGHWRCAHRRHHDGMHRFGNYAWTDDGEATYLPAPPGSGGEAWQPKRWERNLTPTMRQARLGRAWHREHDEKRAAARRRQGGPA